MNEADRNEVTPKLETMLASELRAILEGISVGTELTVLPSEDLCTSLELAIPRLLRRRRSEWYNESLDGIFPAIARKTGPASVQLAGTCILITDQTVTPLLVDLVLSPSGKSIGSFRVCLGEPGGGHLGISGPECNSREAKQLLATLVSRLKDIDWSYEITAQDG